MTDQTEIPIETPAESSVALASPPEEVASPPETLANPSQERPAKGTETFTILAEVPFRFSNWNMCCTRYSAELWQDEGDQTYVTYTHADECEVWIYL